MHLAGEAVKLHRVHCKGCQECRGRDDKCRPSHDPLDQGMCFKEGCENYMNVVRFPVDC